MIVAGFGFRDGASAASLRDAYARVGHTATHLATSEAKAQHPAFQTLTAELTLHALPVSPQALAAQTTPTQSDKSRAACGTGSLAEAAALAAAGPGARLLGPRVISGDRMATCALAEGATP